MDLELDGRRALVTGGSNGIGLAIAHALAREGADVALLARDPDRLARAEQAIRAGGHRGRVLTVVADTADDAAVRGAVDAVTAELGGIDVLVNAAARPASAGPQASAIETADDHVREELEVKLLGYLRTARAVAPGMIERGWGRIVSVSGLNARRTGSTVGTVRNVAVAALTANLAEELGPHGINVTVVHPGLTVTERTPAMIAAKAEHDGTSESDAAASFGAGTTIGRLVTADEVADVVAFLASPRSVAVNGDAIAVGGGQPGVVHY